MKVFVYGTLRKGERNASLLKNAHLVAEQAWTEGELYDTGLGYPAVKSSLSGKVFGELYEVSRAELKRLDQLESYTEGGTNNLYERIVQKIHTDNGVHEAYIYVAGRSNYLHKKIRNEDWKEYKLLSSEKVSLLYFAYGSCMDVERFKEHGVLHYFEKVVGKGVLHNYSLNFTHRSGLDGLGRADIVEGGGVVEGKVYEIPVECLDYLYGREGAPTIYRPTFVTVEVNGRKRQALTFTVVKKLPEVAPPDSYRKEILRGGAEYLSKEYLTRLTAHMDSLKNTIEIGGN